MPFMPEVHVFMKNSVRWTLDIQLRCLIRMGQLGFQVQILLSLKLSGAEKTGKQNSSFLKKI